MHVPCNHPLNQIKSIYSTPKTSLGPISVNSTLIASSGQPLIGCPSLSGESRLFLELLMNAPPARILP